MRLIDADSLEGVANAMKEPLKSIIFSLVDMQPTIEAEPVSHGQMRYYAGSLNIIPHFYCTCCHKVYFDDNANTYRFCPNCGAKMDEVE